MIEENKKAIIWSGLEKGSTYLVNILIQIILARLLSPEDYGVIAMLSIFFAISQAFIDSGFTTTLIQKQDCTKKDYNSVFTFNILVSLIFYLVFFIAAPYLEKFYNFNNLTSIIRVYSLNLILNSFSMVHRVKLMKSLQFKEITIITFISSILSALPAIILAYSGWGYWALILQVITNSILSTILTLAKTKWIPHMEISKDSIKKLAPLGIRVMIVSQFHAIYNNIYSILIGKKFNAIELGYFDRGKTLAGTGSIGFSDFYMRALFPIQSKIQSDNILLEKSYNQSFNLICILILPFSLFISTFSKEFIVLLYGEKWISCAPLLSILTIGYLLYPLQNLNINILKVKGYGHFLLKSEFIKKAIGLLVALLIINFNLIIVAWGWTLCAIFEFLISEYYYFKACNFSISKNLIYFSKLLIVYIILSNTIYFIITQYITNKYLIIILGAIIYLVVYFIINKKQFRKFI